MEPSQEWLRILASFGTALGLGLLLMPAAIWLGRRLNMVVEARLFGKGDVAISYLGGNAVAVASSAAFLWIWGLSAGSEVLFVGAPSLLLLGSWDDHSRNKLFIGPAMRLVIEFIVAAAAWWAGIRSDTPGLVGALGTVAFLVAAMNAFNLLDNMDGVAGCTAVATAGGILLIAIMGGQVTVASLAASLAGACLAFLAFNFHSARLYLGNGGSLFVGFLVGAAALKLRPPLPFPWGFVMMPVLLAVPATDTAVVMISRLFHGRKVTQGGTDHISHRLVKVGLGKSASAAVHALASLVAAGGAALAIITGMPQILIVVLGLFAVLGLVLLKIRIYLPAPGVRWGFGSDP